MPILYERKGRVAYITIEAHNDLNSVDQVMLWDLIQALEAFRDDRDLWVGILTGAGEKAFSVGVDLRGLIEQAQGATTEQMAERFLYKPILREDAETTDCNDSLMEMLWNLEIYKPVIAAVKGYCLGLGFAIMLSLTDIRIIGDNAKFGFPEPKRGLCGYSGTIRLSQQIPRSIAMWMILTGENIDAQEAYRIGLVNELVPVAQVMSRAEEVANLLCRISPVVTMTEKEGLLRGINMSPSDARRYAKMHGGLARFSHDSVEGLQAFREKREPEWKGFEHKT